MRQDDANIDAEDASLQARRVHNGNALISRLPNELLAHIFLQGLRIPSALTGNVTKYLASIVRVTALWRAVAIDTPRLWVLIDYHVSCLHDRVSSETPLERLRVFLERSKEALLHVTIEVQTYGTIPRLLPLIEPHFGRCASIRLRLYAPYRGPNRENREALVSLKGPLSKLQRLEIEDPYLEHNSLIMNKSSDCHSLRYLYVFFSNDNEVDFSSMLGRTENVSSLRIIANGRTFRNAQIFAAQLPQLRTLVITDIIDDYSPPYPMLAFPSLTYLETRGATPLLVPFISEAPNLKHIAISYYGRPRPTEFHVPLPRIPNVVTLSILPPYMNMYFPDRFPEYLRHSGTLAAIELPATLLAIPFLRDLLNSSVYGLSMIRLVVDRYDVEGFVRYAAPIIENLLDYPLLRVVFISKSAPVPASPVLTLCDSHPGRIYWGLEEATRPLHKIFI